MIISLCVLNVYAQRAEKLYLQGNETILKKDFHKALKIFNKYLENNRTNEHAYLLRSEANFFFKNYEQTVEDCKKVFELGNAYSEYDYTAMWNIANAYIGLRNYELALKYLDSCKIHNPDNEKFFEVKAFTYFALNDYNSAIQELQQLLKVNPNSSKAYYGIGRALFHNKELSESLESYNKSIELDPNYGLAYQNRAVVRLALGDLEGHCLDLNKCKELGMMQVNEQYSKYCQ